MAKHAISELNKEHFDLHSADVFSVEQVQSEASLELVDILQVKNILGEGVLWNDAQKLVWWTDIRQRKLYQYDLLSKSCHYWEMPEPVGSFAFTQDENQLIIAFASGIALYHLDTDKIEWLFRPEKHLPGNRFNDGRVDRYGRFWAGTMVENAKLNPSIDDRASLYCLNYTSNNTHTLKTALEGISISNGLCWSPNGNTLYHADSPTRTIKSYRFDQNTATVSKPEHFARTPEGVYPDGSTVDVQGCLWNAQWQGKRVVRYAPDGEIDLILNMPVSQPTCVAFGGRNMEYLFVTSARDELSDEQLKQEPLAGSMFIYKTNIQGIKEGVCNSL